ncbi:hypothetical protein [Pseudochrobactrum kiredjianiae]|uniref:Uncharacterized protein n=1 Tax=Pseudochrobactrum kiredjianiae TaxID=386305 RepID=A0ABW3V3W6_9HYPH|nr:hypothetical protein [Pseudochrobactrum kiredjianiae]MDM7852916.1 hypothetical protein [Pseudochrobactrum kiredjianiae]
MIGKIYSAAFVDPEFCQSRPLSASLWPSLAPAQQEVASSG